MADVFNQRTHVLQLQHEAAVYEALCDLHGTVIPHLVDYGYTFGGATFFIATSRLRGTHPCLSQPASSLQQTRAEQVRVGGRVFLDGPGAWVWMVYV